MEVIPAIILGGGLYIISLFKDSSSTLESADTYVDQSVNLDKSAYDFYKPIDLQHAVINLRNKLMYPRPVYNKQKYHTMEKSPPDVEFVDMIREYKDLCTDIVTNHFFSTDETLFNFLKLICDLYYTAIEQYKQLHKLGEWDIFFIYKGGNILRIISNDFMEELPFIASKILKATYEKYFTRSDCDFSIYIKETIINPKYETVFQDMTMLSYLIQVKIKTIILSDPTKYFDFYKYNTKHQQQILQTYLTKMKESNSIKDPLNTKFHNKHPTGLSFMNAHVTSNKHDSYRGRVDFGMQETQSGDEGLLAIYPLCNNESELYISINETLDFHGVAPNSRGKFTLVRTKVAFNMYFDNELYQIGGELIDVAINHKYDYKLIEIYKHIGNMSSCVNKYTMTFRDSQLEFLSYSLEHLIYDLELILFVEHLPWADRKYEKRLNRLFYLYLVNLFANVKDIKIRKEIIIDLKTALESAGVSVNTFDTDTHILTTKLKELSFSKSLAIYGLVVRLVGLIQILTVINVIDFNGVINTIIKNCANAIEIINKINKYCNTKGKVSYQSLYNPNFSNLIGGFLSSKHASKF